MCVCLCVDATLKVIEVVKGSCTSNCRKEREEDKKEGKEDKKERKEDKEGKEG